MNVQDTCVIHTFPDRDTLIEDYGHVGHGAVLHCCTVRRNALIGMNAVVMDGANHRRVRLRSGVQRRTH